MKTITLSIATALLFITTAVTPSFASTKSDENIATVLPQAANFNNIEVQGNVEVYVTTGETNNVKVYDSYYNQNALVQEQNGTLRISSYKADKLVVWVTVADLRSITASDNAVVKSFGKLSAIDLAVTLKNNATAQLDLDVYSSTIALNDNATAKLSGFVTENNITVNQTAHVNTAKLTTGNSNVQQTNKTIAAVTTRSTDDLGIEVE